MNRFTCALCASALLILSCKSEPKEGAAASTDTIPAGAVRIDSNSYLEARDTQISEADRQQGNVFSKSLDNPQNREEVAKAMKNSFLVEEDWRVETIVDVNTAKPQSNLIKEAWYFTQDGKYRHTMENGAQENGTYIFRDQEMVLEIHPDDTKYGKSEWKLRLGGSSMVWQGTSTYGNNSRMMKMTRVLRQVVPQPQQ